ncbi:MULTISPECIES: hypothetical protein [Peribacillus]|uniref:hypothetical protein n=1 Tax=Peribacillus TaxID=2675229 RepID=UPI0007BF3C81|nr:hypothetical protein [Peribacillus frigoritolerans]MCM3169443.1 hypothetical protein [Peribacillus frigoritolerans]
MKKSIIASLALALVLSFSSFGGTQKAEAADWTSTGSIWTSYYHSGSFYNYVYQRTAYNMTYDNEIWTTVKASSSASGTFTARLQKKTDGVWKNYKTKYPAKNGTTTMNWTVDNKKADYRVKFENSSGKKITYTFKLMQ